MEYTEFDKRMGEYEAVSKVKLTKRMPVVNVLCQQPDVWNSDGFRKPPLDGTSSTLCKTILQMGADGRNSVRTWKRSYKQVKMYTNPKITNFQMKTVRTAENFTKCIFYYDCNSFDMDTNTFMKCVGSI